MTRACINNRSVSGHEFILVLLFAKLSAAKSRAFSRAGMVLLWFSLFYMIAAMTVVFTGFFFGVPPQVSWWLRGHVLAYDIDNLPPYLRHIVQGLPDEKCHTPAMGGGVQLFERGLMVVEFKPDRDNFYAIVQTPNEGVSWFRTRSRWLD